MKFEEKQMFDDYYERVLKNWKFSTLKDESRPDFANKAYERSI